MKLARWKTKNRGNLREWAWSHGDAPRTGYTMTHRCDHYKDNQVLVLVRHRNINDALRVAKSITDPYRRQRMYVTIVVSETNPEHRDRLSQQFLDDDRRVQVRSEIAASDAMRYVQEGKIGEALLVADTIENGNIAGRIYIRVADIQIDAREREHAKDTLAKAIKAAERSNHHYRDLEYLPVIAGQLAELGEMESALRTANSIKDESAEMSCHCRDDAFSKVGKVVARQGDIEGALRFVDENISDEWHLRNTLKAIIIGQARRGDFVGASKTLARNADRLDRSFKELTLMGIALAYATAGNWAESRKTFEEVRAPLDSGEIPFSSGQRLRGQIFNL